MEQTIELLKEPFLWLLSGLLSIVWNVLANLITPWAQRLYAARGTSKLQKNYLSIKKRWLEVKELEANGVERYEQKLDGLHLQLFGVALYLISFSQFWLATFLEPTPILAVGGVFIFYTATKRMDEGLQLSVRARLAHARAKEIKMWKSSHPGHTEEHLIQYLDELNTRDFGFPFEAETSNKRLQPTQNASGVLGG